MKRRLFNLAAGFSLLVCLVLTSAVVATADGRWEPALKIGGYDRGLQLRLHSDLEIALYRNYQASVWQVPLMLLAFPAAILPAIWADRKFRQRRELRKGLCKRCGYDLRASPERCPECGTPVAVQPVGSGRA